MMSGKGWYCPITICPFVVKLLDKMVAPLLFFKATDPPVKSSSVTVEAFDCPGRTQKADSSTATASLGVILHEVSFFIFLSFPADTSASAIAHFMDQPNFLSSAPFVQPTIATPLGEGYRSIPISATVLTILADVG